ncbi:LysM peptidoglycan-binding domain-containing protein [Candidatus Woesebacteria bacterium]|nr:LysM peptidoglycan-binding domain-containing protein [Candidatus Woesebacteria bacterium]
MAAPKKRKVRTSSIVEEQEERSTSESNSQSSFMDLIRRYESELSTLLGVFVVIALAAALFFFIRRSSSQTAPQISEIGDSTNTEDLMSTPRTYTVKSNDGLWTIAQEVYGDGYKWTEIAKANNLESPYTLTEGQELSIPDVDASASPSPSSTTLAVASSTPSPTASATPTVSPTPSATPTPSASPTATPSPSVSPSASPAPSASPTTTSTPATTDGGEYTVTKGDSLWKIAVAQYNDGYKWVEIYNANKTTIGQNPGIIVPGQVLTIPGK